MTKQAVVDEPVPSLENGTDTDDKSSIWASMLRDVKLSTKKAPATKSLVVLGDNESGRTTLVAKLQENDDPKRGAGLEYHYIDVKDDDRDDTPKLGVWILDGDVACSAPLLKFAIKPETLENTILILVASMTQPWSLLSTLKKWTTLIEEHIDRLKIDPTVLRELRDHLQYDFQHYIEPNDTSVMLTSSASSTTIKSGIGGGRVPSSVSSVSLASTTPLSPPNGEEQIVLPLADGVLTKSLGIQMIVVITKCDVMSILEKENDYKDEYFDFMQHHLRKFCLEYGAALFYTSVKEKKNIDKLYKYIVHKCYGYPFTSSAAIVERDAIFIPAGWDNPKKADILLENLHRLKSTDNYSDVFVKPIVRRPTQRDNEIITAEDDQEFLSRLQLTLNRAASPGRADDAVPSRPPPPPKQTNVTQSDPNRATNEGALANFFNSLLTKKSGGAVTPTTAGTPIAQRQIMQSPTTPSSKRVQQNPLTFAVAPPPGRTRTPTSLKAFPTALNVDSPPKLLSPVVEQQPKIETTSSSDLPTTVRASVEDTEPITSQHDSVPNTTNNTNNETLDSPIRSSSLIEDKSNIAQTVLTDESHRRLSNDFSLSSPLPITQISENNEQSINNSSSTIQPRPDSPLQPDEHSNIEHQEISSSKNQSRSTSPVVNNNHNQLNRSPSIDHKSPRFLSSPTLENAQELNNKEESEIQTSSIVSQEVAPTFPIQDISLNNNSEEQQDNSKQSPNSSRRNSEINSSTPSRPLSPMLNEPIQHGDKTLVSPVNIIQTLPGDDPADLHSRNELSNELLRSEEPDRRPSSSDIQQIEVLDENSLTDQSSRLLSTSNVNTSEEEQQDQMLIPLSNTNNNQNNLYSPVEMSDDNHTHRLTENHNSSPVAENHNSLKSPNIDYHPSSLINCQPDDPIFIEDDLQTSPTNETVLSPFLIPQNSEPAQLIGSPTLELGDIKSNSYENTIAPSITEEKTIRSRPPSPTIEQEPERSRPVSPVTEHNNERSRTPSPIINQEQKRSRSPSSANEQKQQRSRSPSPTTKQERSRSLSPAIEQEKEKSRSPSPTIDQKEERSRSPSPVNEQKRERSRSPSPTTKQERSRSLSPATEQEKERSRSPSPINEQKQERSRSPSPINEHKQERSRSPSPINEHKQERSRSPSPTTKQEQEQSRSLSPTTEQEKERSRSPSPINEQKQERSRSPSPINEQKQERSRSPSPINEQKQERSRSPSPTTKQEQERSRSLSPAIEQEKERSRSPSLTTKQEQEQSRSLSPATEQEKERSRSPSPINEQKQERSRSPSPTTKLGQQRSQSLSPATEQEKERSRSPSPTIDQKEERRRSPSPVNEQNQQRSRSPSPTTKQEQEQEKEKSRSPSPTIDQKERRSRSPSPTPEQKHEQSPPKSPVTEQNPERSQSPLPTNEDNEPSSRSSLSNMDRNSQSNQSTAVTIEQKQERSRSPSPVFEEKQERSRSPSLSIDQNPERKRSLSSSTEQKEERKQSLSSLPLNEQKEQRSRSPSPISQLEQQPNRSTSPITEQKQQRSRSPSPTTDQKEQRSRSPSPNIDQKIERRGSSSSIDEDQRKGSFSVEPLENKSDVLTSSTPVTDKNEQLKQSPLSSPLIEKRVEEPLLVPSPKDQQKTSITQNKVPFTENDSSQVLKSPASESVSSSILEKEGTISPIPNISPKQTKRSSVDHHYENNSSPTSIPPVGHQSGITRSQSQSTIARPNTLPFTPNNHDLDGLYMSNDYNDEDEIPDDSEHHHNSAPSTVSVEHRRSSLLYNNNVDQEHTSLDSNEISKRLSIVEKSRMEDTDNNDADSPNSKGT